MEPLGNDRWRGVVRAETGSAAGSTRSPPGSTASPRGATSSSARSTAGQADLAGELAEGAALLGVKSLTVEEALDAEPEPAARGRDALPDPLELIVDRERAAFGAWYELFPRSFGGFAGVEAVLPELAELGFDVIYLPPIHPIGVTHRKGRNNALTAGPGDPGSPWAIGATAGGHTAIAPELGTLDDFESLVAPPPAHGLELALDLALQCSPDHPWLKEHPEWFQRRPDGTLKYAENPPKRYQDIYNLNFDSDDWRDLWQALLDVVLTWVERGVRIFRVDNPHTKPVAFWEWLIREAQAVHPDLVFLSEAFTRPAMMATLAKAGFSQSYTYFTWRNTSAELTEYVRSSRTATCRSSSGRTSSRTRRTSSPSTCSTAAARRSRRGSCSRRRSRRATGSTRASRTWSERRREPGSEEYLDSEKYELKARALDGALLPLVARLNEIRRAHPGAPAARQPHVPRDRRTSS